MNKYFNVVILISFKFVIAEDGNVEDLRKPDYTNEEDAVDISSYKRTNEHGVIELDDDLDIVEKEKFEESHNKINGAILLTRSSKDDKLALMKMDDAVIVNIRRYNDDNEKLDLHKTDSSSDELDQNTDRSNNEGTEDYNGSDDQFKGDDGNTNPKQQEKHADNEYVTEEFFNYTDNRHKDALSVETDEFLGFDKYRSDVITHNTRRMLSPIRSQSELHSAEYSISQTLRRPDYDSNGNYIAETPSKFQPMTFANNLYSSPVYAKLLAKSSLNNTVPRQDTNYPYSSYIPAIINKSRDLNEPTRSRDYNSYEDKRNKSVERYPNIYQFNSHPPPALFNNAHKLASVTDLSHAAYITFPDYTLSLKPFNQIYSNPGYGKYLTSYQRGVMPSKQIVSTKH